MHRLLLLSRRPSHPFPSGFFTQSTSSAVSGGAPSSASASAARLSGGHQRFSGSSRSRPPSSSSSSSSGGAGRPTKRQQAEAPKAEGSKGKSKSKAKDATSAATVTGPAADSRGAQTPVAAIQRPPWTPQTFRPQPILGALPVQIAQDGFFAGHRPLLEVTVSPKLRTIFAERSPLEIVQDSASAGGSNLAADSEHEAEHEGEYDHYLVTEPEGADPQWGKGTEWYLAGLEHGIPPPAPVAVEVDAVKATPAAKAPKGKGKMRQDIDYLFPIQAEQRAAEERERQSAEEQSISAPSRIPSHHIRPLNSATAPEYQYTETGDMSSGSRGMKFLVGQLTKSKWSGMWDFETVRKALLAAHAKASGSGKAKIAEGDIKKVLEGLKAASKKHSRRQSGKKRGRKMSLSSLLLEELGKTEKAIAIIEMHYPGTSKREGRSESELKEWSPDAAKENMRDEIKTVIEQAEKFKGFFDKSIHLSGSGDQAQAALNRLEKRFGPLEQEAKGKEADEDKTVEFEIEWDDAQPDWVSESAPSDGAIDARFSLMGSRLSQSWRGRSLRPTLRARLAQRGVHLVGSPFTVEMDSVKRKRQRRISKHKWVHTASFCGRATPES